MAEELRLIHANEQNNIDLTPVSKIEIYSFSIHFAKIVLIYQLH